MWFAAQIASQELVTEMVILCIQLAACLYVILVVVKSIYHQIIHWNANIKARWIVSYPGVSGWTTITCCLLIPTGGVFLSEKSTMLKLQSLKCESVLKGFLQIWKQLTYYMPSLCNICSPVICSQRADLLTSHMSLDMICLHTVELYVHISHPTSCVPAAMVPEIWSWRPSYCITNTYCKMCDHIIWLMKHPYLCHHMTISGYGY